jgi:hypothetical protein
MCKSLDGKLLSLRLLERILLWSAARIRSLFRNFVFDAQFILHKQNGEAVFEFVFMKLYLPASCNTAVFLHEAGQMCSSG